MDLWTWNAHCTIASTGMCRVPLQKNFSVLHQAIALAVGSRTFTVHVVHRRFAVEQLCGICALRFIDNMLRGKMLPTTEAEALQLHAIGRSLFVMLWPVSPVRGFLVLDLIPKRLTVCMACWLNMELTKHKSKTVPPCSRLLDLLLPRKP